MSDAKNNSTREPRWVSLLCGIVLAAGILTFVSVITAIVAAPHQKSHALAAAKCLDSAARAYAKEHHLGPYTLLPITSLVDAGLVQWDTNRPSKDFGFGYIIIPSGVTPDPDSNPHYTTVVSDREEVSGALMHVKYLQALCKERDGMSARKMNPVPTKVE